MIASPQMRPWDPARGDTDAYREERLVAYFNAEVELKRSLNRFGVAEKAWTSHVGMCVTTRQIANYGDPGRCLDPHNSLVNSY